MKQLRKFAQLRRREQRLLVEAFVTTVICQTRLSIQNVQKLQAWVARPRIGAVEVDRLVWAVQVASKRIPGATCLSCALTLQRLLAKNGHESELRIGVAKDDSGFIAHAWLTYDGQILVGGPQIGKYQMLTTWQSRTDSERIRGNAAQS
jgi:hypothetical protein